MGNLRRITIGYKLKLANNLPETAHLLVFDQLLCRAMNPSRCACKMPNPGPPNKASSTSEWELDLPAQSKREIPYTFTLEHPRDFR